MATLVGVGAAAPPQALPAAAAGAGAAVVVGRRTAVSTDDAQAVARAVSIALRAADVGLRFDADAARSELARLGLADAAQCAGRRACLAEIGRQLGVSALVVVSVSQVGADRSVALELLETSSGAVVASLASIVGADGLLTSQELGRFAGPVRSLVGPADAVGSTGDRPLAHGSAGVVPPPVASGPTDGDSARVGMEPRQPARGQTGASDPSRVPSASPGRSRALSVVLGAVSLVALGTAIALMADGATLRAQANSADFLSGEYRSRLKASEANQRLGRGGMELGAGAGAAGAAVGLGVAAVLTW